MELTRKFIHLSKSDAPIAGGKGASLGEMTNAGIPVPPGFVVLSSAFEQFIKETDLIQEIDAILDKVDHKEIHTVENASETIQGLILNAKMPDDIKTEIEKEFKVLNTKYVAVRSSATAEDGQEHAWAGQLDSFLNSTKETLLTNVKKCWASLFTPRAIFYRFEKGLHTTKISVAVVIQKMVESEISGIAFSVHPVTEDRNQIIIEAGFGLGEAIVSGQITPDSYVVEKEPRQILDINVNTQIKALYRASSGGPSASSGLANEWHDIPEPKASSQVLTGKQILELSEIIMRIENHYGFPCDIEWAYEAEKFYVVQSRPITTLRKPEKINQNIVDYIKSQNWFFGVRADESLLFYSIKKDRKYLDYIKDDWGIPFAETLLVPVKDNKPIRVFNVEQAGVFHSISNDKLLKDPKTLQTYIDKNNLLWDKIIKLSEKLIKISKENKYTESAKLFETIIDNYKVASSQFLIIFSLGLMLTKNKDKFADVGQILKNHDVWRNSVAFKEEKMGDSFYHFLDFVIHQRKSKFAPMSLMKYLTLNEINKWLVNDITDDEIMKNIESREAHGYVYLGLRNFSQEIIDDKDQIESIQNHFLELDRESTADTQKGIITGQVAYGAKLKIKGTAIIIKDKKELKEKSKLLKGKILVAIQTTPHYIPYLKDVKAIITDEGGITCHAAIISREMKKPCIIGTKIATQVLKDGDLVEVDACPNAKGEWADNGIVKIINKEK